MSSGNVCLLGVKTRSFVYITFFEQSNDNWIDYAWIVIIELCIVYREIAQPGLTLENSK